MVKKKKKGDKPTQDEIQRRTFEKPPIIGRRKDAPIPSYVLNRMIQLGIKQAEPSAHDALIRSQMILSQLLKLNP